MWGIPTPAFSTALAFFDGYRSEVVPANLIQAQRDYFGAHTFRVVPGKENAKLQAGQDIRTFLTAVVIFVIVHIYFIQTSTGLVAEAMFLLRPTPLNAA